MWKKLLELGARVLTITRKQQQHEDDIAALRQELKDLSQRVDRLTESLHRMAFELQRTNDNAAHEREKLVLQLEVALLKFEKRLHPGDG